MKKGSWLTCALSLAILPCAWVFAEELLHCTKCGAEITSILKFCPNCGKPNDDYSEIDFEKKQLELEEQKVSLKQGEADVRQTDAQTRQIETQTLREQQQMQHDNVRLGMDVGMAAADMLNMAGACSITTMLDHAFEEDPPRNLPTWLQFLAIGWPSLLLLCALTSIRRCSATVVNRTSENVCKDADNN